jgi:hypothetical protein
MLVAGMTELIGREVRAGRLDRLDRLEDQLFEQVVGALTN